MLLEMTFAGRPATDLGYLLAKSPGRLHHFPLRIGEAHVFYPVAEDERCTAALLVEASPVVFRDGDLDEVGARRQVAHRPYQASAPMSLAMALVYETALSGRSRERPDLASSALPLEARVSVVPCRGRTGIATLCRLFEPLSYAVDVVACGLDSRHATLRLSGTVRLQHLLAHLCVLLAALDEAPLEVLTGGELRRILRHGDDWLSAHPEAEWIASRLGPRRRDGVEDARARLVEEDDPDEASPLRPPDEVDRAVGAVLRREGARRIVDLGCGDGRLMQHLLAQGSFSQVTGLDASHRALERARLRLADLPEEQRGRADLLLGSLLCRDRRLQGFDAATLVDVMPADDPARRDDLANNVLGSPTRPPMVVVAFSESVSDLAGLERWSGETAARFGYGVHLEPAGRFDGVLVVFQRSSAGGAAS